MSRVIFHLFLLSQFKLNPKVQFEVDIGDSVMVNQMQRGYEGDNYEELINAQKGHNNNPQYEGGDGIGSHSARHKLQDKIKKHMGSGNHNMTKFMDELQRKINNKSEKKRHKSKGQASEPDMVRAINEDPSYMEAMEDLEQLDSESDDDKTEVMTKPMQQYTSAPMKVFVRRSHCDDEGVDGE